MKLEPAIAMPVIQEAKHPVLAIDDPSKWQMAVRLFLEKLTRPEAEAWLDNLRLIVQVAGRVVRDRVYAHTTEYCCVCNKRFRDGRPAGTVGYYDIERNYIPLSICEQSEYPDALKLCKVKEDQIAAAEERANKAARQAMIDARQKAARA